MRGGVAQRHLEDRDGQRRVGVVEWDEGTPGGIADFHRHGGISEIHACEGKRAGEAALVHAQKTRAPFDGRAEAEAGVTARFVERPLERRLQATFQHAKDRFCAFLLSEQGEERAVGPVAFVGPVEDLPVLQLSATAERDAARADAAQRECDLVQLAAHVGGRRSGGEQRCVGERQGPALPCAVGRAQAVGGWMGWVGSWGYPCRSVAITQRLAPDRFRPITPAMIRPSETSLMTVTGSWKYKMPIAAMIAVPTPDQMA